MKKSVLILIPVVLLAVSCGGGNKYGNKIDRKALLERNNPHVTTIDPSAPLSVGNGGFCFTADVTGLQSIPESYTAIPLLTESDWGWHSFPNVLNYKHASMMGEDGKLSRKPITTANDMACCAYFASNEHRLNLGRIGFTGMDAAAISDVDQTLKLFDGVLESSFSYNGKPVKVSTSCDAESDMIVAKISSEELMPVMISIPYAKDIASGDPSSWEFSQFLTSELRSDSNSYSIFVKMFANRYSILVNCENAYIRQPEANRYEIVPTASDWGFTAEFKKGNATPAPGNRVEASAKASKEHWNDWWQKGGAIDFSECSDPRAAELERRVVLSQYLTAIQCAGNNPAHNGGLTSNVWYGKIEADNLWWQSAQFALWGHPEQLESNLHWYEEMYNNARARAEAEGVEGARWSNLTGANGIEFPLPCRDGRISQQPQLVYLLQLLERAGVDVSGYAELKKATLRYMAHSAGKLGKDSLYVIAGVPMQGRGTDKIAITPTFEAAYWYYALQISRSEHWQYGHALQNYPAAAVENGIYLCAAENGDESAEGHPAVLGAYGMLPGTDFIDVAVMKETLNDVIDNWDWSSMSGADFAMTAMCATRLGEPEKAIDALMRNEAANTFLANGHNAQNDEEKVNLAGNGGLLSAMALMCAGWDGCDTVNPGFPKEGWNVKWEKINPLP